NAGLPFVFQQDEWSRARVVADLLEGIGLGHPLWHHEWHDDAWLADRLEQRAEPLPQHDRKSALVDDAIFLEKIGKFLWSRAPASASARRRSLAPSRGCRRAKGALAAG